MAIQPNTFDQSLQSDAKSFEDQIDRQLPSCSPLSGVVTLKVPSGMNNSHFQIIRANYIKAGWKDVTWESDQREGDWLRFVLPR